MTSSYTANSGLEKPDTGDQEGAWGGTLNTNFDIIDRVLSGVGSVSLSGTTHTLTTTDGTLTDGMYRVLLFTGALGANNTVTISPNDQDKLYFIVNNTTDSGSSGPYSVIIKQGTGDTVTIENGRADIVYADGAGSGADVISLGTEIGQRAFDLYTYTATAGQTTFTGSDTASKTLAYSAGNLFVTLNGVTLENGTDYTATNGTSVVLTDAATVSDELNIYAFNAFSVANVTTASGDFSIGDDLSFTSDAAVINMGADSDVTLTHVHDVGVRVNTGVLFGSDTAAANALDDYEEGSFTVTCTYDTSIVTSPDFDSSATLATGYYTKIGNLVNVFYPAMTTSFASNAEILVGTYSLPFATGSNNHSGKLITGYALHGWYSSNFDAVQSFTAGGGVSVGSWGAYVVDGTGSGFVHREAGAYILQFNFSYFV